MGFEKLPTTTRDGARDFRAAGRSTSDKHHIKNSKLNRLVLYRGVFSRVARELKVDRSFVSRVASGERRSAAVEAALLREIRRIEKLAER